MSSREARFFLFCIVLSLSLIQIRLKSIDNNITGLRVFLTNKIK